MADTSDEASLRRPQRQRPARRDDPGREALVRLAMLLARQAAAETTIGLVDVSRKEGGRRSAAPLREESGGG